jgi:5'-3' exonuclease
MTIALIDGDVIAYMACKARWETKADIRDGVVYHHFDNNGDKIPIEYTEEEDKQYLEECWENFLIELNSILDTLFINEYLMAVKGEDNFRNIMYSEYKMNRRKDVNNTNHFVPLLRQRAVDKDLAISSEGREADDLLRIWAEECRSINQDYIVCTIDKDLKCIPGKFYNLKKKELEEISEFEAMRHYYEQLLKGDSTDNIPGIPKVGEVRASKLLSDCYLEEDFQKVVIEQYEKAYGEQWKDFLLSNGKMIHLQKTIDDYFNLRGWIEYDVETSRL